MPEEAKESAVSGTDFTRPLRTPVAPTLTGGPGASGVVTVGFVPDVTPIGYGHSQFFQDTGASASAWQQSIYGALAGAAASKGITLVLVPDDGASLNAAAPVDGQIRVAAVDQAFLGGAAAYPLPGGGYLVGVESAATFGAGLGLAGAGLPLSPGPVTPPAPAGAAAPSGPSLPLVLPFQPAYGNLYPATGPSGPTAATGPSGPTGYTAPTAPTAVSGPTANAYGGSYSGPSYVSGRSGATSTSGPTANAYGGGYSGPSYVSAPSAPTAGAYGGAYTGPSYVSGP